MTGDEPVAITNRFALIVKSSTARVSASEKRAAPVITRTPRPAKRSRVKFGATASITSRIWALTAA